MIPFPVEGLLQQLGGLVQQALQQQVTPALQQVLASQAFVEARLEQLEEETRARCRPSKTAGDFGSWTNKRGCRTSSEASGRWKSSSRVVRVTPNEDRGGSLLNRGRSGATGSGNEGEALPTGGTVWIQGVQYAWHIHAGGLQLLPVQDDQTRLREEERVRVSRQSLQRMCYAKGLRRRLSELVKQDPSLGRVHELGPAICAN